MSFKYRRNLSLAVSALLVASCGGSGGSVGSSGGNTTSTTTQPQQLELAGVVQGIGSCVINGKRLSTVGATITDEDGNSYTSSDLSLGQYAIAQATYDDATQTGTATKIILRREFSGPLSNVGSNSFSLLGQTFQTDSSTVFKQEDTATTLKLSDLNAGDYVEVYGLKQADGSYLATHVELQNGRSQLDSGIEARGEIASLDTTAKTFQIGGLTVDYSGASVSGSLANGVVVRVRGTDDPTRTSGGLLGSSSTTLTASSVSTQGSLERSFSSSKVEVNGVVTSDAGDSNANTFEVAGVVVDISNLGSAAKSLFTVGNVLEVQGVLQNGTLLASKVEDEDSRASSRGGRYEFYGVATDGQFSSGRLTFNVQGQPVVFNRDVCGISSGTPYVEVKGELVNGVIQASKVECEGNGVESSSDDSRGEFRSSSFELSGLVENFDSATTQFVLRGVKVKAANARFEDGSRNDLVNGARVEVKGSMDANNEFLVATKVEFEDKD